jgi:hypothetical protein
MQKQTVEKLICEFFGDDSLAGFAENNGHNDEKKLFEHITTNFGVGRDEDGDVLAIHNKDREIFFVVGMNGFDDYLKAISAGLNLEMGRFEFGIVKEMLNCFADCAGDPEDENTVYVLEKIAA